jgi:hypothetical protein
MQFMLLVYLDDSGLSEAQREQCCADSAGQARRLHETGRCIAVAPLQSTSTATSARLRDGKQSITDSPFAETREQLDGFFLVDATDRAEEIENCTPSPSRAGQVRPVLEISALSQG